MLVVGGALWISGFSVGCLLGLCQHKDCCGNNKRWEKGVSKNFQIHVCFPYLTDQLSLVEYYLATAHIVHGAHQPNLTVVDQLAQHHASVAKRLQGELHIHFRDGLDEFCIA